MKSKYKPFTGADRESEFTQRGKNAAPGCLRSNAFTPGWHHANVIDE